MAEWIIHLIERFSYLGIALLMALENVFPPIPSELIMPFAGFVATRGDLNGVGVILAGRPARWPAPCRGTG
jgi:membrane protein DedA with SNARE-associated domain